MIPKNCQTCGKGFGFFNKKAICQICSSAFCEKCVQTGLNHPDRGVLPNHRICGKCVQTLKNPPAGGAATTRTFTLGSKAPEPKDSSMLDQQLENMMEEQQFPLNVRERTRVLDVAAKWNLLNLYNQSLTQEKNEKDQPGYWVEKLQNPTSQIWKDASKMQRLVNTIKSQSKTWCVQLLRDKGLSALLQGFHQSKSDEVKVFALKAVNALISTRAGLEAFLALPAAIQPLILFSLSASNECRFEIFEFLATAVGFSSDEGLPVILAAITSQQCGRVPFKPFTEMLTASATSGGVRFKLLVLINAIVNSADLLEDRQRTRQLLRSADFQKALQWLRQGINNHRATVDGATSTVANPVIASPQVNRQSVVPASPAAPIPIEEARANRASIAQGGAVFNAPGTNQHKIIDQSEVWEMIRVQIELYEHAEEDDSLDATRNGVDFGSIDQLLEYVRVHMAPHVGQYLLPLLQMVCILPLDSPKGQTLWSSVLTVVKRVIGASPTQSTEHLTLDQLFALTEQYAQQASMSASDAILNEKNNLEKQLSVLREKVRELESRPAVAAVSPAVAVATPEGTPAPQSNKELQQLKAEMLGLRTQLSQTQRALDEAKAAAIPPAPTSDIPPAPAQAHTQPSGDQSEALTKALAQITTLQQEIERLKAAGPAAATGPAVATGPTTITINTPQPPILPGFTQVPHQPRTVVIPAGEAIPGGAAAAAGPGGAAAATTPAPAVSSKPTPPVLPGFTAVAGAGGAAPTAAAAAAPASSSGQPDGKPWPPVLPGFKAQAGAPSAAAAGASAPGAPTSGAAAVAAAPAAPVEPPIKLPYTRRAFKPATKMRQLHWTRLEDKVIENTVWFKLNDSNVKLDSKELESLFCQAAPKAAAAPGAAADNKPAVPAKAQQVTFVEGQRGQNMAIAVSRFRPLTFEQIHDAILSVDTKTLSLETATSISKFLPTPEEIEAVGAYDGPIDDLAKQDQYIMIVGKVPALDRRVDAFIFKQQAQQSFDEISSKITQCATVLKNLSSSKALLRVFEYVLAMGNYLNGGTKKGDAYGFEIAYLTQLANTRSCDNKSNLLQYLIPVFDKDPQTASLQEAFVGIEEVARLDIQQITGDVGRFNASINKINGLIKQLSGKNTPKDRFIDVMTPFAAEWEPRAKNLQTQLQAIATIAKDLSTSYGEEPSKFGPTQIFGLYNDFNKQINATRAEMKRQQEMKEKQDKMAAAAAQRAAAGGTAGGVPKAPLPGIGGPGPANPQDQQNALMNAFANRPALRAVPPKKAPTAEDEVATQIQGTLTGSDAGSVLAAIKAKREAKLADGAAHPGQNKRRSVFEAPK